jgi:hypothetical protein
MTTQTTQHGVTTFRNSQEAFIHKHVSQILTNKGHEASDVKRAANFAVDTYRNTASFGGSRGGSVSTTALQKLNNCFHQ